MALRPWLLPASVCGLIAAAIAAPGPARAGHVAEPQSYWTGPSHGDVPASLAHGHVIDTSSLVDLIAHADPLLIDVAERQHRPEAVAPDRIWKPLPHRDIAGSLWLPGAGAGTLDPAFEHLYRQRLAERTKGDLNKAVVFYCHTQCWASWNAAKRAISFGYLNVYWYPEGVEGWRDAGHDLATAVDGTLAQGDDANNRQKN